MIPIDPNRDMFVAENTALTIGLSAAIAVAGSLEYSIDNVIS